MANEILKVVIAAQDQASASIKKITKNLSNLKTVAIAAGSALSALAIKQTIDAFASFDDALQKSIAIMGNVDTAMREKLAKTARDVAKELGISHEEAARSYYYLASAGLSAAESLKAMPAVAKLAKAGALDMAEATDIATDIMTAFGKSVEDLTHINDVLIATVTKSNTNLQQLGEAMKYLAPSAHAAGWSIEEMSAAVGLLSNAGIKASQAGTYLRQIIAQLLDPTNSAKEALARLGLTVEDINPKTNSLADILQKLKERGASASDIMQIFGVRAGTAVLALMDQGVPALRQFTEEIKNAGGITDKVANTQMESFREKINKIKARLQDTAITIGEQLAPVIEDLVNKLQEFFSDEKTQEQIKTFTEGLKEGLTHIIEVLRLVFEILSKLPPGVTKVIGAFTAFGIVVGPLLTVFKVVSSLWGAVSGLTGAIGGLSGVFSALAGVISLPVVAIGALIAAIALLVFNVGGARDKLKEILSTIKDALVWAFNIMKEKIINFASTVYGKAKEIGNKIINGIKEGLGDIWAKIKEKFIIFADKIRTFASTVYGKAKEIGNKIISGIKEGLGNVWETIKKALTDPIEKGINKIKDLLGIRSPSKVFREIGKNIIEGYKQGIATAKDLTPKLPAPIISSPQIMAHPVPMPAGGIPSAGGHQVVIKLEGIAIREDRDIDKLADEIEKRLGRKLKW